MPGIIPGVICSKIPQITHETSADLQMFGGEKAPIGESDYNASLNICRAGSARNYSCGDSTSTPKDCLAEQVGSEKQESPIAASDAATA